MPRGSSPKRVPIVSTGSPRPHAASAESTSTATVPGSFAVTKRQLPGCALRGEGHRTISSTQASPSARAIQLTDGSARLSAASWAKNSAGIFAMRSPSRSRTCESAMMTAMPAVNPVTIATGMKRTSVPRRSAPMAKSSTPAIIVAMRRLATP